MLQVRVDGEVCADAVVCESFDEVLGTLEPAMATRSRIVTAIRVNGVDEPAFRESSVRARRLADDDVIEVDTTSATELARAALADAVRLTPDLCAGASQLAQQLRTAHATSAAVELGSLAEGLTLLVTLVQAAEAWADASALSHETWLGTHVLAVGQCIDSLDEPQRAHDWVTVADILAYDLVPALEAWQRHLAADHAAQE